MRQALRTLINEPRVPNPPPRIRRDYLLVAVLLTTTLIEGIFRDDLPLRPFDILLVMGAAVLLLWRRTHPFEVFLAIFGGVLAFDVVAMVLDKEPLALYSSVLLLIALYSLFRWGSGREAAVGAGVALLLSVVANLGDPATGASEWIGGTVVLALPPLLGLAVRFQLIARRQTVEQAKIQERELIARELHDTVAHHVSAIAIQAQAGRFLVEAGSSDEAVSALATIEEEASRALTEMRTIIGVLRDADAPADLAPQHRIADVVSLSERPGGDLPEVHVSLHGDLSDVRPAVEAAVYRLAQESITNAVRHGRNATRIDVDIVGSQEAVELSVVDDGAPSTAGSSNPGFGLVGMNERAMLLGGELTAGPNPGRGWAVRAKLPRQHAR